MEKELGVLVDEHEPLVARRANGTLGCIRKSVASRSRKVTLTLKVPYLEYGVQFWSPHFKKNKELMERIQWGPQRLFGFGVYEERLWELDLLGPEKTERESLQYI